MGVCNSPNIFKKKIPELFKGIDIVHAYIYDILDVHQNEFKNHLKALGRVLQRFTEAELKVNAETFFLGQIET